MFTYAKKQWTMGRGIYGYHSWREKRRIFLFTARSLKNREQLLAMDQYFSTYEPFPHLLDEQIGLYEVINRVFFYKDSSAAERWAAMKEHFDALPHYFTKEAIHRMYSDNDESILFYESAELGLTSELIFITGQRKEGLLSLVLKYEGEGLYHINFRFGKGTRGEDAIWVGTIQGYKEGLDKAKKLTKAMHGYRPKNFMFFLLRQLATLLGISSIYAVSDEGFYTNTHMVRFNRHKLVKFDTFWEELGGRVCEDTRFFMIPLHEERKTYETAKTHKRNMYRKRYEMLDAMIEEIRHRSESYLV